MRRIIISFMENSAENKALFSSVLRHFEKRNFFFVNKKSHGSYYKKMQGVYLLQNPLMQAALRFHYADEKPIKETASLISRSESYTRSMIRRGTHRFRFAVDQEYRRTFEKVLRSMHHAPNTVQF